MESSQQSKEIELVKENQELRDLCCFLDDERKKSRKLAHEWQSFGRYIASLLRNQVLEFENKMTVLQENLQKLSQENAELRDLCLFLNQMSSIAPPRREGDESAVTPSPKLETEQVETYAANAACAGHLNKVLEEPPQYNTGHTETNEIKNESPKKLEPTASKGESNSSETTNTYTKELEKRLDRLESEKLELVKSLSAAQVLAANANENKDLPGTVSDEVELKEPPNIKSFLEHIKENDDTPTNDESKSPLNTKRDTNDKEKQDKDYTLEDVMKLSTLLDISKRLDAMEMTDSNLQPKEGIEIAALRMLVMVAFKDLKSRVGDTRRRNGELKSISSSTAMPTNSPMVKSYKQGTIIQTEL